MGANERVTMGAIGCGGRGRFVTQQLLEQKAEFSFLCDPDASQIAKAQVLLPTSVDSDKDFRRAIDRKEDPRAPDRDARPLATVLPMILAVQAGKDVYIEKPTAYTVGESRAMVEAAKKTKCIVQIGTQQGAANTTAGPSRRFARARSARSPMPASGTSSTTRGQKEAAGRSALATHPIAPRRWAWITTYGLARLPQGRSTPTASTGTTPTSGTIPVA